MGLSRATYLWDVRISMKSLLWRHELKRRGTRQILVRTEWRLPAFTPFYNHGGWWFPVCSLLPTVLSKLNTDSQDSNSCLDSEHSLSLSFVKDKIKPLSPFAESGVPKLSCSGDDIPLPRTSFWFYLANGQEASK